MNLCILLGNGFDIKLGLKTSYTDFYRAFLANEQSKIQMLEDGSGEPIEELLL